MVESGALIIPQTPISPKVETLECRIAALKSAIAEPMNCMARKSGEEAGYETSTLDSSGRNYHDMHWYWKFAKNGSLVGQIDFRIIVEKSSEGTFTHPLLSFTTYANLMGKSFMHSLLEEEVQKLTALNEKRAVHYMVSQMLCSPEGLLQIAYATERHLVAEASRLLYTAFRNIVTQGYKAHLDEQRSHAIGNILAAEAVRG